MSHRHINPRTILEVFLILFVSTLIFVPLLGMKWIPFSDILQFTNTPEGRIVWMIRVPRVLLGLFAGASLSLAGMSFQAMFRNPLATPFTLGVSSGAALGTAIYIKIGLQWNVLGLSGLIFAAFIGAGISILIVYGLSKSFKDFSTYTMLLAGVAVNFFFSSLILFLQYLSDFTQLHRIIHWLMGGLEITGYQDVINMGIFFLIGSVIILLNRRELNLLVTGEEIALSRGVNVERTKTLLFITASLMVGAVVAFCGPIGFVGMMVPHICRLLIGFDHTYLAPASLLLGGVFLVLCDTFARTIIAPAEIPVGVITALLGGPFFVWLLISGKKGFKI